MEATPVIDWQSDETHLLLNPRTPAEDRGRLERLAHEAPPLRGHIWIATSGTSGALRLTALSKGAILASARAVNRHLGAVAGDVWCCVLPTFHVGGLGIHARAELAGSRVVSQRWEPDAFCAAVRSERVTLSALVPAQLRDLISRELRAPEPIRAIVIGGGAVSEEMYSQSRSLGWPVLPSYGMTEAASQIATATGDSPALRLLSHVEVRTTDDGRLTVRGGSLLTGYASFDASDAVQFVDPKIDGWFVSEDRGEVHGSELVVYGRVGEFLKIGGESVDLQRLDAILDSVRGNHDLALFAADDERLGHVIRLASTIEDAAAIVEAFNARVLPYERIRFVHRVPSIPRSPLGKLLRARLARELQ